MKNTFKWEQYDQHFIEKVERIKEEEQISKEEVIQEIKETHLECLDAMDINHYAAASGLEPNEVRRMMIQPDNDNEDENFMAIVHSFDNDDADSFIDYW